MGQGIGGEVAVRVGHAPLRPFRGGCLLEERNLNVRGLRHASAGRVYDLRPATLGGTAIGAFSLISIPAGAIDTRIVHCRLNGTKA
jgi:hypothetical protein